MQRREKERLAARTALEVFCVPGTWACQDLYSSTLPGSQLLCEATPQGACVLLLNPTQPHLHHTYLRNFNNEFHESLTECFWKEVPVSLILSSPLAAQAGFSNSNDSTYLSVTCAQPQVLQASFPKVSLPQPGHKGQILSMGGARKPSSSGKLALTSRHGGSAGTNAAVHAFPFCLLWN